MLRGHQKSTLNHPQQQGEVCKNFAGIVSFYVQILQFVSRLFRGGWNRDKSPFSGFSIWGSG
jgi:hypothetical protein